MLEIITVVAIIGVSLILSWKRASLSVWTIATGVCLLGILRSADLSMFTIILSLCIFVSIATLLNVVSFRKKFITRFLLSFLVKKLPTISETEREALEAGTVGWEGTLFSGKIDWEGLINVPVSKLTVEEQAFIDGPVKALCDKIDDWRITHHDYDLSEEIWTFIKENRFFGLVIPREYGGLAFSATAHSEILTILAARSATVSTTVSVPNSLGPAELIWHYGTAEQKNFYLPRLAHGEEIPCFGLTAPDAGSDAGAIPDYGVVCQGEYEGQSCLGIKLNWNKRYITLAPVATLLGLAFKLFDPEHLLGAQENLGITCALIPTNLSGVQIGRRHFPLNCAFQNGPTQGKDVFVPLKAIIGGEAGIGRGWQMLVECLGVGRAISLPATAAGGAKVAAFTSGAYARIRRQFNMPIANFEGIQLVLAQIVGKLYLMESTRLLTTAFIDQGQKPAVLSAISKYHLTELGRDCGVGAMDIHGGKGICLGPKNYLGRGYQAAPIAITVEGANILTRSLIIFGQGAIRCHPYLYDEILALTETDQEKRLNQFDKVLFAHIGFSLTNIIRAFSTAVTGGRFLKTANFSAATPYARRFERYSHAFILAADCALILLGGELKRKEGLSARFGDIFSYLYMGSAVLKRFYDQGKLAADFPLVEWVATYVSYQIEQSFLNIFKNFPSRGMAWILKRLIFPFGMHAKLPTDRLSQHISQLVTQPSPTRDRLINGLLFDTKTHRLFDDLNLCLKQVIAAEDLEKMIRKALPAGDLHHLTQEDLIKQALEKALITSEQALQLQAVEKARQEVIAVDDFDPKDLSILQQETRRGE
jgi:acyl-CoA dehydrogenase